MLVYIHEYICLYTYIIISIGSVAFYQEYQSEQTLEALTNLVPPRCNVIRDGEIINILAEELVPGDLLRLASGDRISADAR
jgi:Ca2+-transporting ATPase